jgi:hypothetical protein
MGLRASLRIPKVGILNWYMAGPLLQPDWFVQTGNFLKPHRPLCLGNGLLGILELPAFPSSPSLSSHDSESGFRIIIRSQKARRR